MASGHARDLTTRLSFVRYGRIAADRVMSLHDRFWLQAAFRRIVIYFRLTSSSRNSDAEVPLMIAHRTHA